MKLSEMLKEKEFEYRRKLDNQSYLLLRLDGKSFHNYTKGLNRPYDTQLMEAMNKTLLELCEEIQGVRFGYVESDEISLLISAFTENSFKGSRVPASELWMGGIEAKILSLSAAYASTVFNDIRREQHATNSHKRAIFDSRLWQFSSDDEGFALVQKYFAWRRLDSIKNSVTMAALAHFSHRELMHKNTDDKILMLQEKGFPWEELPERFRFGSCAYKTKEMAEVSFIDKRDNETKTTLAERTKWNLAPAEDLNIFWDKKVIPRNHLTAS